MNAQSYTNFRYMRPSLPSSFSLPAAADYSCWCRSKDEVMDEIRRLQSELNSIPDGDKDN